MFDHVHLRVSNLAASKAFYETVLEPLGHGMTWQDTGAASFGNLYLSEDRAATTGVHIAFIADGRAQVEAFHAAGLHAGYRDNGPPGERRYHAGYYAAFLLDPDGNNIEAVFHDR